MKRVVITGMGIYSVLGKRIDEVKAALYEGRSGIIFDPLRKELGFRSALTGALEKPNLKAVLQSVYLTLQMPSRVVFVQVVITILPKTVLFFNQLIVRSLYFGKFPIFGNRCRF